MAWRGRRKRAKLLAPLQSDRHQVYLDKKAGSTLRNNNSSYGSVVRRTVMFQFRLAADSLRDLLLSPISVIAALLGLLRPDNPGWALDRLMQFGRRTDDWINLFEHNEHARQEECTQTLDDFIDQVETEVKRRMDPDTPADEATWASSVSAFVGRKPASS